MDIFDLSWLYEWATGDVTEFTEPYVSDNEKFMQMQDWWFDFEGTYWLFVLFFIALGFMGTVLYYSFLTNTPGKRFFTPIWWACIGLASMALTFAFTFVYEYVFLNDVIASVWWIEFKLAFVNAVYAGMVYLVLSFIWCNWMPTNAYRCLSLINK